ncbi:MAG: hypothetical protein H0V19_02005, partial [Euzebyales bacterium]|nr:hypothetical protein [Euzebyales bacterium]
MDTAGLERGERAPDFVLPRGDGTPTRFYALAGGRPAVVCLFDPAAGDQARRVAALSAALREEGAPD